MSDILDRNLSPAEMREKLLRADRAGWYAGEDPRHHHAIISRKGRVVARCESLHDRDFLMVAAGAHDAPVGALEMARAIIADTPGPDTELVMIDDALAKARGAERPPVTPESVAGGRRT